MGSKKLEMETIFDDLTDKNKDMMILLAKSIQFAQQNTEEKTKKPPKKDTRLKTTNT